MNKLIYRQEGRYDLLSTDKHAQYVFQLRPDAPKELSRSFLIAVEKDENFSGSALEVANELKSIIDSYWINTDQPRIKALVEYLEKWEEKDYYDGLILEREKLQERLTEVERQLSYYDPEEWDKWTLETEEVEHAQS